MNIILGKTDVFRGEKVKQIQTQNAVGHVLCHDITQIVRGVTKEAVFRKGHIVTKEDIPVLLSVGKDYLYVWEQKEGILHENEAAEILCNICKGNHITRGEVKEGKIDLFAECDGLLKVNTKLLNKINSLGEMMIATRYGNFSVQKGEKVAGTRIIPLLIEKTKMETVKEIANGKKILEVKPYLRKKVGIITTGNEVYYNRIRDEFTSVIIEKLNEFPYDLVDHIILQDDNAKITEAILQLIQTGSDFVICTGGMSVDPDDKTPLAIKNTGSKIITYGAPVLPGAMFMLAYYQNKIPIVGLPGCVMFAKRTIFDLMLPRIMANDKITVHDIRKTGHGGLCLSCNTCVFPKCSFGKG